MIKAKNGFILQKMMDSYMIIAVGESAEAFRAIIQTNETGAFYWRMIEKGTTLEALIQASLNRFDDLEESDAERDITEFLERVSSAIEMA